MMDGGGSSLTMSVQPNVITSNPGGGRFDFDDGGLYCGGWQDGKAHGYGVCTGPKNVGEYSGSYNFGFEMSGVYRWANGALYEGRWQNGKRHGVGVEYNGKWIYKGEWSQGFKGRYGVKASSNSAVKYEGTWANGLQDGYGSETYSDGGYYQGQMCRGLRHGYGVRKSAPYGDSQVNNPNKNGQLAATMGAATSSMLIHANSLQSAGSVDMEDDSPKPEDGFKPNIDRTLASKNGFVLVAKPLDVPASIKYNNGDNSSGGAKGGRRGSLTSPKFSTSRIPGSNSTASILKGLRLRKQKSTSDLDAIPGIGGNKATRSNQHSGAGHQHDDVLHSIPFTLSPEELDITDPTTVETYTGEWKHDKRNGHGVCDRSDGLKYEGQWHNDMKCGYGVTTLKNGTIEEGKYKNNILIVDSKVKRFFQFNSILGSANIRQKIDEAVKLAQQAQTMALKKAEIADNRAATARDKADQAMTAAFEAGRDSQIAYGMARLYSEPQHNSAAMDGQQFDNNSMLFANSNPLGVFQGLQRNQMSFSGAQNPLQLRRNSQANRDYGGGAGMIGYQNVPHDHQISAGHQVDMGSHQMIPPQQQQQSDPQKHHLGTEPFNGRRGSFRGGLGNPGGFGSHGSSQHGPHGRQTNVNFSQQQVGANQPGQSNQMNFSQMANRQSSDPFNDLFDHYKFTAGGQFGGTSSGYSTGGRSRRVLPSRQTSLDNNRISSRGESPGGYSQPPIRSERMRSFRMSSMDHAEENSNQQRQHLPQDISSSPVNQQQQRLDRSTSPEPANESDGRQNLSHLVTKGEELQQGSQTNQQSEQQYNQAELRGNTPTGSSSFAPPSTHSVNSSGMFANQNSTPSPTDGSYRATQAGQNNQISRQTTQDHSYQPNEQQYPMIGQRQAMYYANHMGQRDVHSLADEQLYISAGRRMQQLAGWPVDRGEFTNYDFTINSGPRMAQRCIRRTASLSRHNSAKVGSPSEQIAAWQSLKTSSTAIGGLTAAAGNRLRRSQTPTFQAESSSPALSRQNTLNQRQQHAPNRRDQMDQLNVSGSQLTIDSTAANCSAPLSRKPSLQVRYDPNALGGLMSREEVAALSHAQREHKRIQSELAERRAKRPLLHLYLSIREFISNQRLLLAVVVLNVCLFKMFADLVA